MTGVVTGYDTRQVTEQMTGQVTGCDTRIGGRVSDGMILGPQRT